MAKIITDPEGVSHLRGKPADSLKTLCSRPIQVPIDPLRERYVMSLGTCIGREHNVFNETTGHADSLCGEPTNTDRITDGELTCAACAQIVLKAIELTTKVERREWRKL